MHSLKEIDDFQFHFLRGMMLSVEPDESEGEAFSLWDIIEIAVLSIFRLIYACFISFEFRI